MQVTSTRKTMPHRFRLVMALAELVASWAVAAGTPDDVSRMVDAGQFKAANTAIDQALAQPGQDAAARDALLFQRERMRRILLDFTLDAEAVKSRLRKQIPDLRDDEFTRWDEQGLLERMVIDGRVLYFKRDPSNLFRLSAEASARRDPRSTCCKPMGEKARAGANI